MSDVTLAVALVVGCVLAPIALGIGIHWALLASLRLWPTGTPVAWTYDGGDTVHGTYLRCSSLGHHRAIVTDYLALPQWVGREVVLRVSEDGLHAVRAGGEVLA